MNMSEPRISVIMPSYNTRQYIPEAIASILAQTMEDFELIVVDNGSTDGSHDYARSVLDPRVRVIMERSRGAGLATNAGIAASRASLLAIMDSDDVAHPNRLKIQLEFMDTHPDVVLLGAGFKFLVGSSIVSPPQQPRDHDQIRRALLEGRPVIHNPSTMFRKNAAIAIGGHHFPGPGADCDFFLRMSDVGKLHNLTEALQFYRLHDQMTTVIRMLEVNRILAYGVACAKARAEGRSEPNAAEFDQKWSQRSLLPKVRARADCRASALYRKAILLRAEGKWLRAAVVTAPAALLNPNRTVWHIKRQLRLV